MWWCEDLEIHCGTPATLRAAETLRGVSEIWEVLGIGAVVCLPGAHVEGVHLSLGDGYLESHCHHFLRGELPPKIIGDSLFAEFDPGLFHEAVD